MKIRNVTRNRVLGDAIRGADTFLSRFKGLLWEPGLREGEGLWVVPCNRIHSFGMRFEFDALFLDSGKKVVGLYRHFRKNRISRSVREAEAFASRMEIAERMAFLGLEEVPGTYGMEWRTIRGETSH